MEERQNVDNKLGEGNRGFIILLCSLWKCPEFSIIKTQTKPTLYFFYQKNRWNPFPYSVLLGQENPTMTSSSDAGRQWCGGIFFRQHTPALPFGDSKSLYQMCRCFLRAGLKTLRSTDSLPPPSYSKFLASMLLSDGHLETPMPELCFKGCLELKAGTLRKLSQYAKVSTTEFAWSSLLCH